MVYESPVWKDAYKPGSWESLFPAILHSKQGSSDHVKKLIAVGFSCITFLRNVFPQSVYQMCVVDNLHVTLISEDSGILCPNMFVELLYSAFEAIDKKYLKELSMIIFDEHCEVILEVYTFKIKYLKDGEAALAQFFGCSDKIIDKKLNVKGPTLNLLRSVIVLTQTMLPLPDNIAIRFYLDYYETETPSEYHPQGYMAVDPLPINFHDSVSLKIGCVKTLFHSVQLHTVIQPSVLEETAVLASTPAEKVCSLEDSTAKGGKKIPLESPASEHLKHHISGRKSSRHHTKPCKMEDTKSVENNSSCKLPGLTDSSAKPCIVEKFHQGPAATPTVLTQKLQSQKGAFRSSHDISKAVPCSTFASSSAEISVRCPCGLGGVEDVMLLCSCCGLYQHGACFRVLEADHAPSPHVCELCARIGRSCSDYSLQNPTPRLMWETCILRRVYSHLNKVGGRHTIGTLAKTFGFGREMEEIVSRVLQQDGAFFNEEQPHASGWLVNMSRVSSVLIPRYFRESSQRADHTEDMHEGSALLHIQQAFENSNHLSEASRGKDGKLLQSDKNEEPLTCDDIHLFGNKDHEVEDLKCIDEESLRLCGSEVSEYSLMDNTLDISAEGEQTDASQDLVENNSLKVVLDKKKSLVDFLEEDYEDVLETESIVSRTDETVHSLQTKSLNSSLSSDPSKLPNSDIDVSSLNLRTPNRSTVSRCQSKNIKSSFVDTVIDVCHSANKKDEKPNNDRNIQETGLEISAGSNVYGTAESLKQDLHGNKSRGSWIDNSLSELEKCPLRNVSSFHHHKMNEFSIVDQGKTDSSANSAIKVYNIVTAVGKCSDKSANVSSHMEARRSGQENVNIEETACKNYESVRKQNIRNSKVCSEELSKTHREDSNHHELKDKQFQSVSVNKDLTKQIPTSGNSVKDVNIFWIKPREEHTADKCKEGKRGTDHKVSKDIKADDSSQSKAIPQNRFPKSLSSKDETSQSPNEISRNQTQNESSCSYDGNVNGKNNLVSSHSTTEECKTSSCSKESHLSYLVTNASEKSTEPCDVTKNHSEDRNVSKENINRMGKGKFSVPQEGKESSPIKVAWNATKTYQRHGRKFTKQRRKLKRKTRKDTSMKRFLTETPRETQSGGFYVSKYIKGRVIKEKRKKDENGNINIDVDITTPENALFGTTAIVTALEGSFHKYQSSTYKSVQWGDSITCCNECGRALCQCDLSSCLSNRSGYKVPALVVNSADRKSILKKKNDDDLPLIMAEWKDDDEEIQTPGKRSHKDLPNHEVEPRPKYLKASDLKKKPRSTSQIYEDVWCADENDGLSHGSVNNSLGYKIRHDKGRKFFKSKVAEKIGKSSSFIQMNHTSEEENDSSCYGSQSKSFEDEPTPEKGPTFFKEKAFRKTSIKNNCNGSLLDSLQAPFKPKKEPKFFKSKAFSNASLTESGTNTKVRENTPKFFKTKDRNRLNKTVDLKNLNNKNEKRCTSEWTFPSSFMLSTTSLPKLDYVPRQKVNRHQQDLERSGDE